MIRALVGLLSSDFVKLVITELPRFFYHVPLVTVAW